MKTVVYHSAEWLWSVETGWVTMFVSTDGIATMLFIERRKWPWL